MRQFKLGWNLLRYAYGIKTGVICGGLCIIGGLVINFFGYPFSQLGNFFLMMGGLWVLQVYYSIGVSNMVQSCPWKKQLETSIPALICFVASLIGYLLVALLQLPHLGDADGEAVMVETCIGAAVLAFLLMVYMGAAYKLFVLSTIGFFVVVYGTAWNLIPLPTITFPSAGVAVVVGLGIILLGAVLQYAISCLVYKLPLSKKGQIRALQKIM